MFANSTSTTAENVSSAATAEASSSTHLDTTSELVATSPTSDVAASTTEFAHSITSQLITTTAQHESTLVATTPAPVASNWLVYGGIGGALALAVVVIALIALMYRRNMKKRRVRDSNRDGSQLMHVEMPKVTNLRPDSLLGITVGTNGKRRHKHRKIMLREFEERVNLMHTDNDFRFQAEFERLNDICERLPDDRSQMVANANDNSARNRFVDILPYDDTRVVLDNYKTDYINASYIDGHSRAHEYIATQGPINGDEAKPPSRKTSTVDDFWHMIWQTRAVCLVMLTQCVEDFRPRCAQYWPKSVGDSKVYGELSVTLADESNQGFYVTRELTVSRGGERRRVVQWHMKEWQDTKGVRPQHLIDLIHLVRNAAGTNASAPVVVHCSAGVGRTGTLIALDQLLHHVAHHNYVDVMDCVLVLRRQRVRMVQTQVQYTLLYDCLNQFVKERLSQLDRDRDEDGLEETATNSHSSDGESSSSSSHTSAGGNPHEANAIIHV